MADLPFCSRGAYRDEVDVRALGQQELEEGQRVDVGDAQLQK